MLFSNRTSNLLDKNSNVVHLYFDVFVPGHIINLLKDQSGIQTTLCDLKQACFLFFLNKSLLKTKSQGFLYCEQAGHRRV